MSLPVIPSASVAAKPIVMIADIQKKSVYVAVHIMHHLNNCVRADIGIHYDTYNEDAHMAHAINNGCFCVTLETQPSPYPVDQKRHS